MTYGEKIAHLRKSNGMTQEDLGKVLNVTYQAVSKWERGESLPDFTTMSQIAKFFQVPLSYFEEDGEIAQTQAQEQTQVTYNNYVGTCTVCGRMIKEDDDYIASPKLICKSCAELEKKQIQKEREELERRQAYEREKSRRNQLGTGFDAKLIVSILLAVACYVILIVNAFTDKENDEYFYGFIMLFLPLGVFGLVHAIADLINEIRDKDDGPDGYTRNLSFIIGGVFAVINIVLYLVMFLSFGKSAYFIGLIIAGAIISFTFVSQYMWGSVVRDIFTCGGFTFKMPGFIFSLTPESIIWMIVTKIFLGILSILIFLLTSALFGVVAIAGSVFTFVPCVIAKTVKDKNA